MDQGSTGGINGTDLSNRSNTNAIKNKNNNNNNDMNETFRDTNDENNGSVYDREGMNFICIFYCFILDIVECFWYLCVWHGSQLLILMVLEQMYD